MQSEKSIWQWAGNGNFLVATPVFLVAPIVSIGESLIPTIVPIGEFLVATIVPIGEFLVATIVPIGESYTPVYPEIA